MTTKTRKFPYGILVREDDIAAGQLFGFEHFMGEKDEMIEKRMDEIIITAANYASCPTGLIPGAKHFTWMVAEPFEDPIRVKG